ncbi:LytTR family transcriptional regulator [Sphingomonas lacunae]|uniref:LytTR family transcriptional regulator n=1 Tax=Sphingomonas lacunae TaxID=2698828 RepID=A0A6M4ATT3_9SPHN|nr:LytTR family DNA-binding domain-containing protein [Sphingomonas lacunae]QJQ32444.1 LytTR family transcriptional regulator [Sphingomonas lacunae]
MATFDMAFSVRRRVHIKIDGAELVRILAVPFCVGFLFGWISEQNSEPGRRLACALIWGLLSASGWLVNDLITRPLSGSLKHNGAPLLVTLVAGFLVAAPLSIVLNLSFGEVFRLWGFDRHGLDMLGQMTVGQYLGSAVAPLVLWLSINLVAFRLRGHLYAYGGRQSAERVNKSSAQPAASVTAAPEPDFLWKMRPALRGTVYAIKAELHYVRVFTDRGEDLIHYRFRDAVAAMEKLGGMQVHRSWCVAPEFVLAKSSRSITLKNDLQVPVGRLYRDEIRQSLSNQ